MQRIFQIGSQRLKLLERAGDRAFGVVLLEWLFPVRAEVAELRSGFRRGKAGSAAIHCLPSFRLQGIDCLAHSFQIVMEHANKSAAQQEIESRESNQRRGFVEGDADGIFYHPALLEDAGFRHIAQAMAIFQVRQDFLERADALTALRRTGNDRL